jgi:hypothetical protein
MMNDDDDDDLSALHYTLLYMEVYKMSVNFVWPHPLPPVGGFPGNGDMYRKATKGKGKKGGGYGYLHSICSHQIEWIYLPLSDRHIEMNVDIDKSHSTGEGVTFAAGQGTKKEVGIC